LVVSVYKVAIKHPVVRLGIGFFRTGTQTPSPNTCAVKKATKQRK